MVFQGFQPRRHLSRVLAPSRRHVPPQLREVPPGPQQHARPWVQPPLQAACVHVYMHNCICVCVCVCVCWAACIYRVCVCVRVCARECLVADLIEPMHHSITQSHITHVYTVCV